AADYARQRDRLDQDLALTEDALQATVMEHLDVERIINFAQGVLGDAARVWERASGSQRRPPQAAFFADGGVDEPPKAMRGINIAANAEESTVGSSATLRTASMCLPLKGFAQAPDVGIAFGSATGIRTPV